MDKDFEKRFADFRHATTNLGKAKAYVDYVLSYQEEHNEERILAAERFLRDLENPAYELDEDIVDFAVHFIENSIVHQQGDDMFAMSIRNKPLILQPWQHFTVVNLFGFYHAGTNERRFKEALIMLARKNGKTSFIRFWMPIVVQNAIS